MTNKYPIVTGNIVNSIGTGQNPTYKTLIIGQSNSANITTGELQTEVNNDKNAIKLKYGATQHITQGILAYRDINSLSRLDAIAINDNGAGASATATITFTGASTANGTLQIAIDSKYDKIVNIPIANLDTVTAVATSMVTAITALTNATVTAGNVAGVVTITAVNKGTIGNEIGIEVINSVAGITTAITAMSGGATDPVITSLLDVIEDKRYRFIIAPSYMKTAIITELNNRYNVTNDVLDGVLVTRITDTVVNLSTALDLLDTFSNQQICDKLINTSKKKGSHILENSLVVSAVYQAEKALLLEQGANISKFTTNGQSVGGAVMNGYPHFNTPLWRLPVGNFGEGFTKSEVITLENKNATLIVNNDTRTSVIEGKAILTLLEDRPEKKLTNQESLRYIRETFFYGFKKDYSQSKMSSGRAPEGSSIVTRESFITDLSGYINDFVGLGIIPDNQAVIDAIIQEIKDTLVFNFVEGSIAFDFLANLVIALEGIIFNVISNFNN